MIVHREMELPPRAHLVGVGGAGMAALARLLRASGVAVSGSDACEGPALTALLREGTEVWTGSHPDRVRRSGVHGGWVVRSAAVSERDPEYVAARQDGGEALLYAEALGRLSRACRTVAIAGTHGKTSTTALCAAALRGGGIDTSHVVGGECDEIGGSGRAGSSGWLVAEACEWNRSFHQLSPVVSAVLNLDPDHFDCYPTYDDLIEAFAGFVARTRSPGLLLVGEGAPSAVRDARPAGVDLWTVAADPDPTGRRADCRVADLRLVNGCAAFDPIIAGELLPRVHLRVPGRFQVHNALFALAVAVHAGADPEGACAGVSRFGGVGRRFEVRTGRRGGVLVDDYAHHPTEIDAVLAAARGRFPGRRLLVVFQPHQHQRTRALLDGFARALSAADRCLVADIYGAREGARERSATSAEDLVAAVRACGGSCDAGGSLTDLPDRIRAERGADDVLLMLGAGDIGTLIGDVLEDL